MHCLVILSGHLSAVECSVDLCEKLREMLQSSCGVVLVMICYKEAAVHAQHDRVQL